MGGFPVESFVDKGASLDGVKYIAKERIARLARRERPHVACEVGIPQIIVQSDTPSRQAATIVCIRLS